jgi:hypothetical protein
MIPRRDAPVTSRDLEHAAARVTSFGLEVERLREEQADAQRELYRLQGEQPVDSYEDAIARVQMQLGHVEAVGQRLAVTSHHFNEWVGHRDEIEHRAVLQVRRRKAVQRDLEKMADERTAKELDRRWFGWLPAFVPEFIVSEIAGNTTELIVKNGYGRCLRCFAIVQAWFWIGCYTVGHYRAVIAGKRKPKRRKKGG